MNKHQAISQRR